ncbi:MAG TPA: OmpW family outer membrane protein [Candidatus Eisenbacteria bacterium]|nr:OmpW family outer membrane protein [Candidatus Eisenbacteria bacterium]
MRKTSVVLVAVALLAVSSMAHAATMTPNAGMKGDWLIGPIGGLSIPSGDLSDASKGNFKLGYNIGGLIDYGMTENVGVGVDGAYHSMTNKDDSSVKAKTTNFGAHGNWYIPTGGKIMPYIGVGVGYYNRKIEGSSGGVSVSVSKGGLGVNGGVGVGFPVGNNLGIGVDGRYHWTTKDRFVDDPTAPKINWSFITVDAAILYRFSPGGHTASGM